MSTHYSECSCTSAQLRRRCGFHGQLVGVDDSFPCVPNSMPTWIMSIDVNGRIQLINNFLLFISWLALYWSWAVSDKRSQHHKKWGYLLMQNKLITMGIYPVHENVTIVFDNLRWLLVRESANLIQGPLYTVFVCKPLGNDEVCVYLMTDDTGKEVSMPSVTVFAEVLDNTPRFWFNILCCKAASEQV